VPSPEGKTMSSPTTSIDVDRDIGNFFYDLKPTRDAGVGLTEQTIEQYCFQEYQSRERARDVSRPGACPKTPERL
jgi:hypothetical protein